jgi:hypothetical protein
MVSSGALSITAPVILGGSQSWTNNSTSNMSIGSGGISIGTFGLTISGSGSGGTSISGAISGSTGGLTVSTSTGVAVVLSAAAGNSYSGGTTVSTGTLIVTNTSGSGTGSGTVAVSSGGTLGGTGFIDPSNTVTISGTLAPGAINGLGTLTINNSTTLSDSSTFQWNVDGSTGSGSLLSLTSGTLTLGSSGTVNFQINDINVGSPITITQGETWTVATQASGSPVIDGTVNISVLQGGSAFQTWLNDGGSFALVVAGGSLDLVATPEPAHILLIAVGAMGIGFFIRRRWTSVASVVSV